MDSILGHRPATKPPIVIDTSQSSRPVTPITPAPSEGGEGEDEEDQEDQSSEIKNDSEAGSLNSSSQSLTNTQPGSRKRKRSSKSDNVAIVDLMERVINEQTKSDEQMIDLEEKRMRMEERQMEREAKQRREER